MKVFLVVAGSIVVLLVVILSYSTIHFKATYQAEVTRHLSNQKNAPEEILSEKDIQQLPDVVKKYIRYTGAVGKPKVRNFKIIFSGKIRKDEQSGWMPFTSEQYNFLDTSTRLFFLNATMKHLPVAGLHKFVNGRASMDIRLLSLVKVQYQSGNEMDKAETVTFFNDMCCMAPGSLIDKRITWLQGDDKKVKAQFSNNGITVSAWLYFNNTGELTNFISDDRYALVGNKMMSLRWSTPLGQYKLYGNQKHGSYAQTIYAYPKGDFCYGTFSLTAIEYNL